MQCRLLLPLLPLRHHRLPPQPRQQQQQQLVQCSVLRQGVSLLLMEVLMESVLSLLLMELLMEVVVKLLLCHQGPCCATLACGMMVPSLQLPVQHHLQHMAASQMQQQTQHVVVLVLWASRWWRLHQLLPLPQQVVVMCRCWSRLRRWRQQPWQTSSVSRR